MLRYRLKIADATHCNICGEMLSEQDLNNKISIRERLSYWSGHEDEEHRVVWCVDCFVKLLKSCKHDAQVTEFTRIEQRREEDCGLLESPCTICGTHLTEQDFADRLVIQTELKGHKYEVRFCQVCFQRVIKSCRIDSFIHYWGNYSHVVTCDGRSCPCPCPADCGGPMPNYS